MKSEIGYICVRRKVNSYINLWFFQMSMNVPLGRIPVIRTASTQLGDSAAHATLATSLMEMDAHVTVRESTCIITVGISPSLHNTSLHLANSLVVLVANNDAL